MRLVLASASPRRLELLASVGISPDTVRPANINEAAFPGEIPARYVCRMASAKADAISAGSDEIVLAADTVVSLGRRVLGNPADADDARLMLGLLSGRRHSVLTAVAVNGNGTRRVRRVKSIVRFRRLDAGEIERYLETREWQGKAGGYAIQGRAACFIPWISGSHSGIVGLPLAETTMMLLSAGYKIPPG